MSEQPNIVFILPDHQAYYGHHRPGEFEYQWPRFEEFAAGGVRFDHAYAVCPLCSPARSSMMSGVYPTTHGIRWNTDASVSFSRRDFVSGQQLYSHYLSQAGYRNAYVGKWHCGHDRLPIDYGMEGWSLPDYGKVYMSDAYREYAEARGYGDARAVIDYNLNYPEWRGQTVVLHDPSPWKFMNGTGVLVGPPEAQEANFVSHLAVEKLRELSHSSQPFSMVVSYWGPHQPFYPSEPYASMVDPASIPEYPSFQDDLSGRPIRYQMHRDISHRSAEAWPEWSTWQEILGRCYGQGYQNDAAIGQVLDELDELGLSENTIVIWCADHGDAIASHGGLWDKASTFIEEVGRVPFAVRWPSGILGGQHCDELISNMDVTATMLDAAGVPTPEYMDSRSLLPLCQESESAEWSDQLICEHNGHGDFFPQRILLHDRYKYVAALYDGDELYDLEADPYEMNNLIDVLEMADVRSGLRGRVRTFLESIPNPDRGVKGLILSVAE